jgi:SAM-dependent methyltransferase
VNGEGAGGMGIVFTDARNLLESRNGQSGGKVVTLGRQTVCFHDGDVRTLRSLASKDRATESWFQSYRWGDFAEDFFRDVLKFETVESIDFSAYEGASIIHDLGEPLPPEHVGKFDLAVDCGTLEHVFNFPVAIGNLMKLVRVGGSVYTSVPCNNLCGHGFYQFSPELMYRVFSAVNGFEPIFVRVAKARYLGVELTSGHPVYDVVDPDTVHQRINLMSSMPVYVTAMARRVSAVEPFRAKVLQSDYVAVWAGQAPTSRPRGLGWLKAVAGRILPMRIMRHVDGLDFQRKASLSYRRHFRRIW